MIYLYNQKRKHNANKLGHEYEGDFCQLWAKILNVHLRIIEQISLFLKFHKKWFCYINFCFSVRKKTFYLSFEHTSSCVAPGHITSGVYWGHWVFSFFQQSGSHIHIAILCRVNTTWLMTPLFWPTATMKQVLLL